ncbi:MAG: YggS family pyridoxal phosphate-dependent enzyme [Lachnospiraceae bacterium]|nr:YggS family pyridoxal phosphate-dependent enzyme [Lachnospiraceae bacterium]
MVGENYLNVKRKIDAVKSDRKCPEGVTLIAVSKTKPVPLLMEAYEAGARDFGENKVQEILAKYDEMPKDVRWHMIGHLQTNKVRQVIDKVVMIHSVDSLHLAKEISKEAVKKGIVMPVLIEVNVAGEESKFGVSAADTADLIKEAAGLPGISVRGLMTIAPYVEDPEENRQYFVELRQLAVDIKSKNIDNVSMDFLSMGMTGDYETAVSEGATHVRVGTGIFGERDYHLVQE